MKLIIDGKQIEVNSNDKNIVNIADKNNIPIAAPCYRAQKTGGCCKSCIVEINGKKNYACGTKPLEGMNIVITREDLIKIRKEKIKEYQNMLNSESKGCGCGCSENKNDCC